MKKVLVALCLLMFVSAAAFAEEKTYKPDDEGYIRNWLLLEPIALDEKASEHTEDSQKAFFEKEYFPDQFKATPKDGEKVKVAGADLTWHAIQSDDSVVKFDAKDNSLYIGVVYVTSDKEYPGAFLSIGSDDSSLWRVNGAEVARVYAGRAVDKDQDKSKALTLNKGVNIVNMAVINGGGETGGCARFLDKDGAAIKALTLSLTPPAK